MKVKFTEHVLIRMSERGISRRLVVKAIMVPDLVQRHGRNALFFRRVNGILFIKIIAIMSEGNVYVITCYFIKESRFRKIQ